MLELVFKVNDKATPEIIKLNTQLGKLNPSINKANNTFLGLDKQLVKIAGTFLTINKALDLGRSFIETADSINVLNSRLGLVTKSTNEFTKAQAELFKISQDTRNSYSGTIDLFTRIARSTKDVKASQETILGITKTINQAVTIGGGDAASVQAALIQLGQAFQANFQGVGQELSSLREQAPRVYEILIAGTGKTSAEFKKLAENGALTSEIVLKALQSQAFAVQKEFGQISLSVGQSTTTAKNSITALVAEIDKQIGITKSLSSQISNFASSIDANRDSIVDFSVTSIAYIGKTADNFILLGTDIKNTAELLLDSVGIIFFGSLEYISKFLLETTKVLNSFNLSSDETLKNAQEFYDFSNKGFTNFTQSAKSNIKDIDNAFNQANISIEDRIKSLKGELESTKKVVDKSGLKIVDDKETEKVKKLQDEIKKLLEASSKKSSGSGITKKAQQEQNKIISDYERYQQDLIKAREDFLQDFNNLGRSSSEIEKNRLQSEFEVYQQFIDKKTTAYQGYVDTIAELERQIEKENKQRTIQKLENENTFISGAKIGLIELNDTVTNNAEIGKKAFAQFAEGSATELAKFVTTGKADFGSLAKSIIQDLIKIQIQKQIVGLFSGALGGFSLNADGNAFASQGVTPFAKGGAFTNSIVDKPTPFAYGGAFGGNLGVMGEAGAEAIMPLDRIGGSLGVKSTPSNVILNITNNSNQEINAEQISEMTRTNERGENERIINIVINGVSKNQNGLRDMLKGI